MRATTSGSGPRSPKPPPPPRGEHYQPPRSRVQRMQANEHAIKAELASYADHPKQSARRLRQLGVSGDQVRLVHQQATAQPRAEPQQAAPYRTQIVGRSGPMRVRAEAPIRHIEITPQERLTLGPAVYQNPQKQAQTTRAALHYQGEHPSAGRSGYDFLSNVVGPALASKIPGTEGGGHHGPGGYAFDAITLLPFMRGPRAAMRGLRALRKAEAVARAVPKLPEHMPPEVQASARKITAGLSFGGAKQTREAQDVLYSEERTRRALAAEKAMTSTPGSAGHQAALRELRGQLPKLGFDALKGKFGDKEVQDLFTYVSRHPTLRPYEKVSTHRALTKVLGGEVPAHFERKLLHKTFGPEFVKAAEGRLKLGARVKKLGLDVANIPRSLMASMDVSAPFRQGLVAGARHPKMFAKNFPLMLKQFGSERVHQETMQLIHEHPLYGDAVDHGLSLTELGPLHHREEQFMSNLAEDIPVVGRGVRASGRAYVGFLDKMRMDMYAHHAEAAQKFYGEALSPEQKHGITRFINSATGRGSLGRFQNAAVHLNTLFFSPRLLASRVNLLNPGYYARLDPYSRGQALRSMTGLVGFVGSVLYMAKLAGAKVEMDPRNADWAKMRIGNTRVDLLGGFQQPVRLAAQVASGKVISSTTGDALTLGPGLGNLNRQDIVKRFFEGKLAPTPSIVNDWMKGTDFQGQPFSVKNEAASHLLPLSGQDAYDLYKDRGNLPLAVGGYAGAATGIGVQTYGPRDKTKMLRESHDKLTAALEQNVQHYFHRGLTPEIKKALRLRQTREIYLAQNLGRNATAVDRYNAQIDLMLQRKMISHAQARRAKGWAATQDEHVVKSRTSSLGRRYFGGGVLSSATKKIRERGGHLYLSDY